MKGFKNPVIQLEKLEKLDEISLTNSNTNTINENIYCYYFEGLGWVYEEEEGFLIWAFDGPSRCCWQRFDQDLSHQMAELINAGPPGTNNFDGNQHKMTAHSKLEMIAAVGYPVIFGDIIPNDEISYLTTK